eukprot:3977207-Pyramimonas_sp.AAC.1
MSIAFHLNPSRQSVFNRFWFEDFRETSARLPASRLLTSWFHSAASAAPLKTSVNVAMVARSSSRYRNMPGYISSNTGCAASTVCSTRMMTTSSERERAANPALPNLDESHKPSVRDSTPDASPTSNA